MSGIRPDRWLGAVPNTAMPVNRPPLMPPTETWQDIPGYGDRYQASDWGRVRSKDFTIEYVNQRGTTVYQNRKGVILRPGRTSTGHRTVVLAPHGSVLVHHCVLLAFYGPAPEGYETLHLNGDRGCNALSNLKWGSHSENMRHRKWHREPTAHYKLTPDMVQEIKRDIPHFTRTEDLGRLHGVSGRTIRNIRAGVTHRDVDSP